MHEVENLAKIKLHGSTLVRLSVEWAEGICTAELRGVGEAGAPARLQWSGVSSVEVPHSAPWGQSASVLEGRGPLRNGRYEIVMQSGDMISVCATGCTVDHSAPH
ncbi:MAG TPA: hypothetical protein VHM30_09430 [Gemmatimonadaceae bacterium]|nr:hypothetical protein [Gemmatimonadaceae bacterium]